MAMQSLLVFQIIADVVLCLAILFLLMRIGRNIGGPNPPGIDAKYLLEFRELIQESRNEAARFTLTMEESYQKFKELALELEEKERSLARLFHEVKGQFEKFETLTGPRDTGVHTGYDLVLTLLKAGASAKEIAQKSGLTEGEVSLILDLENKRKETSPR